MTKYYKDESDDAVCYVIVSNSDSVGITMWQDDLIDVNVVQVTECDFSMFTECPSEEALAAYHKFENRCKEIINSTGV